MSRPTPKDLYVIYPPAKLGGKPAPVTDEDGAVRGHPFSTRKAAEDYLIERDSKIAYEIHHYTRTFDIFGD